MPLLDIPSIRLLVTSRRIGAAILVASSLARPEAAQASASRERDASPSCAEATTIPLAGAVFTPQPVEGGLRWDARFIVALDTAYDFRGGVIPLAAPLPAGEELAPTDGLAMTEQNGGGVGLCVASEALRDRTISASFFQPVQPSNSSPIVLGAPIAAGPAVQIVETSLGETWLELVVTPPFEKHVGYVAPRAIGAAAREEARRLTGVPATLDTRPIYVRGDDAHADRALTATIADPRARTQKSAVGTGIVFAVVVGALVLAARKLRETANVERADALLASEIDAAARSTPANRR